MTSQFKKQLSLMDLTFIGLGAIFGSGWLFSASHVYSQAYLRVYCHGLLGLCRFNSGNYLL